MVAATFNLQFAISAIGFLIMLFFAVLFLQSGFDKVTDRKGNLEWLTGHFSKSLLRGFVPLLLSLLTIMELAVGLGGLAGIGVTVVHGVEGFQILFYEAMAATVTLLALFTGQRIAKDYGGAAGIVPYLIISFGAMVLFALVAQGK